MAVSGATVRAPAGSQRSTEVKQVIESPGALAPQNQSVQLIRTVSRRLLCR